MLEYNKSKPGRANKTGSSPRDMQLKFKSRYSHDDSLVLELTEQIFQLRKEIDSLKSSDNVVESHVRSEYDYTAEEFNEAVISAAKKEVDRVKSEYKLTIDKLNSNIEVLESKISSLEDIIKQKDNMIKDLSANLDKALNSSNKVVYVDKSIDNPVDDLSRPEIEDAVIDPTDDVVDLEPHIDVDSVRDTSNKNKQVMANKLNKLKDILG